PPGSATTERDHHSGVRRPPHRSVTHPAHRFIGSHRDVASQRHGETLHCNTIVETLQCNVSTLYHRTTSGSITRYAPGAICGAGPPPTTWALCPPPSATATRRRPTAPRAAPGFHPVPD
ncbi:MAG: hypothetical protein RMJ55_20235, partial [Roseiflexaceae bacterium]|nr:hypothetical protein [Roseiflexaceae bacterium]